MKQQLAIAICLFLFSSCAPHYQEMPVSNVPKPEAEPSERVPTEEEERFSVPPGVDALVARESDSLAALLFVRPAKEDSAQLLYEKGKVLQARIDPLWQIFLNEPDSIISLSHQDSLNFIRRWNEGIKILKKTRKIQFSSLSQKQRTKLILNYERARDAFCACIQINPFFNEAKKALAICWERLAQLHESAQDLREAIHIRKNQIAVNQGDYGTFSHLASDYYKLEMYPKALDNFYRAEELLLSSAYFQSKGDTEPYFGLDQRTLNNLITLLQFQAKCEMKLYRPDDLLLTYYRLLDLVPKEEHKSLHNVIEALLWDNGDIHNREQRNHILEQRDEGKYEKAREKAITLLGKLKSPEAIKEVNFIISQIDFYKLDQRELGISRLKSIVNSIINSPYLADSSVYFQNQLYLDQFGDMCWTLGKACSNQKRKKGLAYYNQAITFPWKNRGLCYYEIAYLSFNNPDSVIKNCRLALQYPLPKEAKVNTYTLLTQALRQKGLIDQAKESYRQQMKLTKEE